MSETSTPYYRAPPEPSDADLLAIAHEHGYRGPTAGDARIVALMRAARNWRPSQESPLAGRPSYYIPKVTC